MKIGKRELFKLIFQGFNESLTVFLINVLN